MKKIDKKSFRKEQIAVRNAISEQKRLEKSRKIMSMLKETAAFKKADNIMCFVSFASEVYTHDFIKECIKSGKNVIVPYIDKEKDTMELSLIKSFFELESGFFGILEPKKETIRDFPKEELDIIVTPCVAFDSEKYRIGYGKGYYDRFFAKGAGGTKIGVCFSENLVDNMPRDEFDIPVDMVITDEKIIN